PRRSADQRHRELPDLLQLEGRAVRPEHLHEPRRREGSRVADTGRVGVADTVRLGHPDTLRVRNSRRNALFVDESLRSRVMHTCPVFHIAGGTVVEGGLGVLMAIVLFIGSVYLLLSAVFGRWMAYLITMVALTGWLMIMSSMWFLGYFAQGPTTPRNQGPRGS